MVAQAYADDIVSWVTGRMLQEQTSEASELLRSDFLFRDATAKVVVHVELQTDPNPDLPLRMLDYGEPYQ